MGKLLILFDVDQTIVSGTKVHEEAFNHAAKKVYGVVADVRALNTAGKTDKLIALELLGKAGIPEEKAAEKLEEYFEEMARYYLSEADAGENGLRMLPGVNELMDELDRRGFTVGLLTGNLERIARKKLKFAGVKKVFELGGFGDSEHVDRAELVQRAIERAEKQTGIRMPEDRVVLVGDTPGDVQAARIAGAKCIAVATGMFGRKELEAAGADLVVDSLVHKDEILAFLGSFPSR